MATKQEMCRSNLHLSTDLGNWQQTYDPQQQLFNVVDSRCPLQVARYTSPTVATTELKNNLPDGAIIAKVRHWSPILKERQKNLIICSISPIPFYSTTDKYY